MSIDDEVVYCLSYRNAVAEERESARFESAEAWAQEDRSDQRSHTSSQVDDRTATVVLPAEVKQWRIPTRDA